jgi:site-specific DNA-methyltransferase (adenine-specific)
MKRGSKTSNFGTGARINHDSSEYYDSKLYSELPLTQLKKHEPDCEFPKNLENQIISGDAQHMKELPDNSVHLMITSPPYNVSKAYDEDLSLKEYLQLLRNVFTETHRILVNGGRACINIANVGRKPYIPLSDYVSNMMIEVGFLMRGEIIWNKGAGAGVSMAWGSWQSASNPVLRDIHEYILVFSKGDYKRDSKGKTSTITREQFMEWTKSVWTMNPESAKKVGHPAPFPVDLPYRLIQLYSFKHDIVIDPFMGSGTTAVAAWESERIYFGYEVNEEYFKAAVKRLHSVQAQLRMSFDTTENALQLN